jgi:GNAT superfamily N-acetyltransferase
MHIRPAIAADWEGIWPIFQEVVAPGDTYALPPDISSDTARALWMDPPAVTFVAVDEGAIVGTYLLKPNQPGLGAHVANGAFMVSARSAGRGVGRARGEPAIKQARAPGYQAMQFNFVVSTNARAVRLWQSLGFFILGTIPKAFRHRALGLTDVYVMHRAL